MNRLHPKKYYLALTAALFHVFNHSVFKSLLFFGAGAVQTATGERDMEHLGGLIHRMPKTAFTFLVGCAAISALPPLNGFVSEWLTFQALLHIPLYGRTVDGTAGAIALAALAAAAPSKSTSGSVVARRNFEPSERRQIDRDGGMGTILISRGRERTWKAQRIVVAFRRNSII